jgi:SAM-dependent methyltransferase
VKYDALAPIYDRIMNHVEYDEWVALISKLLKKHFPEKQSPSLLELGGGTGILGKMLANKGFHYTGSDLSPQMSYVARKRNLLFTCANAMQLPFKQQFDCIIFLYDGINYLTSIDEYSKVFHEVYKCLTNDGIFLFDITTETNSIKHFYDFTDYDEFDNYSIVRHSYYDEIATTQFNDFTIFCQEKKNISLFKMYKEHHEQKVFPPKLIEEAIPRNLFNVIGVWDGFTTRKYTSRSERIHFLLKKHHHDSIFSRH